jgi:hypothetical protein
MKSLRFSIFDHNVAVRQGDDAILGEFQLPQTIISSDVMEKLFGSLFECKKALIKFVLPPKFNNSLLCDKPKQTQFFIWFTNIVPCKNVKMLLMSQLQSSKNWPGLKLGYSKCDLVTIIDKNHKFRRFCCVKTKQCKN